MLPNHEVLLPAFTCPVVKRAVEVAGKRTVYVDIAEKNLNSTSVEYAEKIRPGSVLLPTHLFGIATDIEAICELARDRGCVTIEDAAAAFGAKRNGRWLGTFGDVGIFSFERSKRLPAFRGAAIIINNHELIDPAKLAVQRVVSTKQGMPFRDLAFALVYNVATHPSLYGRFTLPRLLGRSTKCETPEIPSTTPFYNHDFHAYQAGLVLHMLGRIDGIRSHIARLVSIYREAFRGTPIQTFLGSESDDAGLLRFPVAFPGRERSQILRLALQRGVYLETNYERPLPEESEYARVPNSLWAAQNVVLLPLYKSLSPADAADLARKVIEVENEASRQYSK
jgi:dTDP-4-amino-4,6-dideoxygalactose transaminase